MSVERIPCSNPLDPAALEKARQMRLEAERIAAANQPPETLVAPDDLVDANEIAGMACRPFSAGLFAVLQMIDHPFVSGQDVFSAMDEKKRNEKEYFAMLILFYLLLSDTEDADLVRLARSGPVALENAAVSWSFKLDHRVLKALIAELPEFMKKFGSAMDIYGGEPDGKKK
jgi:hypothetical protein